MATTGTANTRLRENPILQRMHKNEREWVQYSNELAKWVIQQAKLGDGSITDSSGTTISGLDEMPGTLASQDSLNTVTAFNRNSMQSASPLTAADVGADTTITIAAHDIVYDGGTVSYNAGSITGLAFATGYFVYAEDADKEGGAVTYLATITGTNIAASAGRYYVGAITTPADGAGGTGGAPGGGGGIGDDLLP